MSTMPSTPDQPAAPAAPPVPTARPVAASRKPLRLGQLLVSRGELTQEQLDHAMQLQRQERRGQLLGQVLVECGYVSEAQITAAVAASIGVPFARLDESMVQADGLGLLPRAFLDQHNLLPLSVHGEWITVAAEHFSDMSLSQEIARLTAKRVQIVAATAQDIREVRERLGGGPVGGAAAAHAESAIAKLIDQVDEDDLQLVSERTAEDTSVANLENAAADSPIIKLVNFIIRSAVEQRASDIHIEPEEGAVRVRLRIDGDLVEHLHPPARLLPPLVSRIKILAGMDISERRLPQDGAMSIVVAGRQVDLRVSTAATRFGEKTVIRVLDNKGSLLSLDALGFHPALLPRFKAAIAQKNGIVLVTGPTGSGKSTTLYASLSAIATAKRNISTIEDPIEYSLRGINQFQVNPKAGFTFAVALRALLRQDPDIVMVGEIRDAETAKLAAEAALTGHLVLATLHTNDAPSAMTRLVNMGVEPFLVAASLRAVLAQRLVRRNCPHCTREAPVDPPTAALLRQLAGQERDIRSVHAGVGCPTCRGSGCRGRVAIHELLLLDEAMLEMVGQGPSLQEIRRRALERGVYHTLIEDGLDKLQRGLVSVPSLLEVVAAAAEAAPAPPSEAAPVAA